MATAAPPSTQVQREPVPRYVKASQQPPPKAPQQQGMPQRQAGSATYTPEESSVKDRAPGSTAPASQQSATVPKPLKEGGLTGPSSISDTASQASQTSAAASQKLQPPRAAAAPPTQAASSSGFSLPGPRGPASVSSSSGQQQSVQSLEEVLLEKATMDGIEQAKVQLSSLMTHRAQLDSTILEEVSLMAQEASKQRQLKEASALMSRQLEEKQVINSSLEKELAEMKRKCSEQEVLLASKEASVKKLEQQLAEAVQQLAEAGQSASAQAKEASEQMQQEQEQGRARLEQMERELERVHSEASSTAAALSRAAAEAEYWRHELDRIASLYDGLRAYSHLLERQQQMQGGGLPPQHFGMSDPGLMMLPPGAPGQQLPGPGPGQMQMGPFGAGPRKDSAAPQQQGQGQGQGQPPPGLQPRGLLPGSGAVLGLPLDGGPHHQPPYLQEGSVSAPTQPPPGLPPPAAQPGKGTPPGFITPLFSGNPNPSIFGAGSAPPPSMRPSQVPPPGANGPMPPPPHMLSLSGLWEQQQQQGPPSHHQQQLQFQVPQPNLGAGPRPMLLPDYLTELLLGLLPDDGSPSDLSAAPQQFALDHALQPYSWNQHYHQHLGTVQDFMRARPNAFIARADGLFQRRRQPMGHRPGSGRMEQELGPGHLGLRMPPGPGSFPPPSQLAPPQPPHQSDPHVLSSADRVVVPHGLPRAGAKPWDVQSGPGPDAALGPGDGSGTLPLEGDARAPGSPLPGNTPQQQHLMQQQQQQQQQQPSVPTARARPPLPAETSKVQPPAAPSSLNPDMQQQQQQQAVLSNGQDRVAGARASGPSPQRGGSGGGAVIEVKQRQLQQQQQQQQPPRQQQQQQHVLGAGRGGGGGGGPRRGSNSDAAGPPASNGASKQQQSSADEEQQEQPQQQQQQQGMSSFRGGRGRRGAGRGQGQGAE